MNRFQKYRADAFDKIVARFNQLSEINRTVKEEKEFQKIFSHDQRVAIAERIAKTRLTKEAKKAAAPQLKIV